MAREIVVQQGDRTSRFTFAKVDRAKLYGARKRVPLDPDGEPCVRGELTPDGSLLLRSGMTAQGYFDEKGYWYPPGELQSVWPDGTIAESSPSTLNQPQALTPIGPREALDVRVHAVYALEPSELDEDLADALQSGTLFRCPFNYRPGHINDVLLLVHNPTGYYGLVGRLAEPEWIDLETVIEETFTDDFDDDLDFEMF